MPGFHGKRWRYVARRQHKIGEDIFHYWIKQYDDGSVYGIEGGRISKLMIKCGGEIVCNYDRGWDIKPVDEDTE